MRLSPPKPTPPLCARARREGAAHPPRARGHRVSSPANWIARRLARPKGGLGAAKRARRRGQIIRGLREREAAKRKKNKQTHLFGFLCDGLFRCYLLVRSKRTERRVQFYARASERAAGKEGEGRGLGAAPRI